MFTLKKTDHQTQARTGVIETGHGSIQTPFFMPVGTNGVVKSLSSGELKSLSAQVMLSNTYHLYLRPGVDIIKHAGGLHKFISWDRPMLTDSGGYQVFSLAKLRKITDEGVKFQSHLDGSTHFFTPEMVIETERTLGSDMIMPLDECAPYPCEYKAAQISVKRTTEWAKRSKEAMEKTSGYDWPQFLFGIVQGATFQDLREQSARELLDIGFDAYAIGGVSVGEPVDEMFKALGWVIPHLPEDKPRYFMGIGLPDQIVKAVGEGVDMFDTCLPTRYGRHGSAFTRKGQVVVRNAEFTKDLRPVDETCGCFVCQNYSRSYIRHLFNTHEITALRFLSYHNVYFYVNLMKEIRQAIEEDRYDEFQKGFLLEYNSELLKLSTI